MDERIDGFSSAIVLEEGASFPKWIAEYQRRAPNSVVVAHTHGESMADLTARVTRRLNALTGELRVGIVACAPTVDEAHLISRERLCRTLLDTLTASDGGEVVLAANVEGSDGSKHAIFELAGALCDGLRGTRRVVRVRFSSGRPESAIVPSLAAEADTPEQTGLMRAAGSALEYDRARSG